MERRNEMQVGLITIFSLVVLIAGMMWFKQVSVNRGVNMYQADFTRVEGLQVGDRIQVRGIRAGQVDGFEIMDGFVRVRILIDDHIELTDQAQVSLGTKGIVGEVVIEIDPGAGGPVLEGHIFQGRTAASITDMTDAASSAVVQMNELMVKINVLLDEISETGRVVETLTAANSAMGRLDELLADNREGLAAAVTNLAAASGQLRELLDSGKVDAAFDDAAGAAARADSLLATLETAAVRLDSILAKIDEGEGTAALLLNDPALYEQTDATMTSLQRLLDEMRRNPKKYFKLDVF